MLVSVLAAVAVVEVFLRLAMPVGAFVLTHDVFRISVNPNVVYELAPGVGEHNADGLRDRDYPVEKDPGVYRIMVVGDSIAYGLGVRWDQAYAKILEKKLNDNPGPGPRFEVINLGVPGYGLTQILERLKTKGLKYKPDLVIYGYWLDDIVDSFSPFQKMLYKTKGMAAVSLTGSKAARIAAETLMKLQIVRRAILLYKSLKGKKTRQDLEKLAEKDLEKRLDPETLALYQGFCAGHGGGYQNDALSREPYAAPYVNTLGFVCWNQALSEMAGICSQSHIPCLLVMTPLMEGHEPGAYRYRDLHGFIRAVAGKRGFKVLDLKDAFTGHGASDIMDDDPEHPNALGHEIIAENLYRYIRDHWRDLAGPGRAP